MTVLKGQGYTGIRIIASGAITAIEDSNFVGNTNMITIQVDSGSRSKEVHVKNCRFKDNQAISRHFVEVGCLTSTVGFPTDGGCPTTSANCFVLENCQIEQKNPDAYGSNALSVGVKTDQFHFTNDQILTLNFDYRISCGRKVHDHQKSSRTKPATDGPEEREKDPPNREAIVGGTVGAAGAVGGGLAIAFLLKRKFGHNGVGNRVNGINDLDFRRNNDSDESSVFDDDYDDNGHRIPRGGGMAIIL
jgi:hypothetical protein